MNDQFEAAPALSGQSRSKAFECLASGSYIGIINCEKDSPQTEKEPFMTRKDVLDTISDERDFQEEMLSAGRADMRPELQLGSVIAAMEHNLAEARAAWYKGSGNNPEAMDYIRKVTALGVQAGESFGMPARKR
jgi:hypothetical protein